MKPELNAGGRLSVLKLEPSAHEIAEKKLYREMGLSDEEYNRICEHLGRRPNYVETGIYSVMWSEHCSYKNSKPVLRLFPTEGARVLQGPGEGAGIVDIGDGQAVVFKIESHNHPSAVEPYQGAATGVGGIIRDVFSMGARPIALLNSLRFGPIDDHRVRYLFEQVVAGIADYGNRMEIPTVGGEVVFAESYRGNPLVNAMCVGLIDHKNMQKGVAEGVGNPVIYAGARTGRDGIHGATFASEELSEGTDEKPPSVPVGDPHTEKLLLEACLELIERGIVKGIQDMGAAGLTSSSAEMACKAGNGVELDLDQVPQRDADMTPYELMLSESQERMLLVVEEGREDEVRAVFNRWGINMAIVGRVTGDGRLRLRHKGAEVGDVPVRTLVDDAPVYEREARVPDYYVTHSDLNVGRTLQTDDCGAALKRLLQSPTIANKRWVYRQFDYAAQGNTLVKPGSDAAVVGLPGTKKALAMATDGNGRYVYLDPHVGGAIAVAEAARNVVCSGAEPLAMTNCLNFGSPENPEIFWQLQESVKGMRDACEALQTPVTGGNVSLYNETEGEAIYPTPIVGMVGLVHDVKHITKQAFTHADDTILLLGKTYPEFGGSEWQHIRNGEPSGRPPRIDLKTERLVQRTVLQAIQKNLVRSAHDLSEGGLAVALAEACIGNGFGANIHLDTPLTATEMLFSESQSRILLSVNNDNLADVIALAAKLGVSVYNIGKVTEVGAPLKVAVNGQTVVADEVSELSALWEGAIPCHMNRSMTN